MIPIGGCTRAYRGALSAPLLQLCPDSQRSRRVKTTDAIIQHTRFRRDRLSALGERPVAEHEALGRRSSQRGLPRFEVVILHVALEPFEDALRHRDLIDRQRDLPHADLKDPKDRAEKAIRQNQKIQPTFFYVTDKDNLMLGIAMENRALDAAVMKRHIEKMTSDVGSSSAVWSP